MREPETGTFPWMQPTSDDPPEERGGTYQPILLPSPPALGFTFASFVTSPATVFAVEMMRSVAEGLVTVGEGTFLYAFGGSGLGKTHLLAAVANATSKRQVQFIQTSDLEAELERSLTQGTRSELRHWLGTAELLLLDDIHVCQHREDLQEELLHCIDRVLGLGGAVIATADVTPGRLEGVTERLRGRLASAVLVGLHMGDPWARREMLARWVPEGALAPEVVELLATKVSDNVRHLQAAARQLVAERDATGVAATLERARAALAEQETRPGAAPLPEGDCPPDPSGDEAACADRFKRMVATAETEEEQALALEIAVGERLRQLRSLGSGAEVIERLERGLELLRAGKREEALQWIAASE